MATDEMGAEIQLSCCTLCLKQQALYTCPRCNVKYCSVACYKSEAHLQCSENFYKECFMEGLRDHQTSAEEKQKVLEMLQRLENENPALDSDDDIDIEEDLADRLDGLDLDRDTDKVWEKLTKEEKEEFQKMLSDGRLGNMVDIWTPWWTVKKSALVEEVGSPVTSQHPAIKPDIAEFHKLFPKGEPSEMIRFTVINLLYGYVYLCRLYNGDFMASSLQAATEILKTSTGLGSQNFSSVSEAIQTCIDCIQKSKSSGLGFCVGLIKDVKCVVESCSAREPLAYTLAALSHLYALLKSAKKLRSKALKNKKVAEDKVTKELFTACKKTEFLLSWTVKYGERLSDLLTDLDLEFCTMSTELASHAKTQNLLESAWGGRQPPPKVKLIEELTDL